MVGKPLGHLASTVAVSHSLRSSLESWVQGSFWYQVSARQAWYWVLNLMSLFMWRFDW